MFTYEIKINEKNRGWTTLGNCVRPFTYGTTLDDTLDSGKINVKCATSGKVIKPFTLLSIAIYEDNVLQDTVYCLVANAEREMVRRDGTPLYNHNIEVVELSKLLERDVCDTMTVTNYLGHNYVSGATIATAEASIIDTLLNPRNIVTQQVTPQIYSPQLKGATIQVPITRVEATLGTTAQQWLRYMLKVITPDGTETYFGTTQSSGYPEVFGSENGVVTPDKGNPTINYTLAENGVYEFVAEFGPVSPTGAISQPAIATTFRIAAAQGRPAADDWTITEVTQRLLSAGVTRRVNAAGAVDGTSTDAQKYVFDSGQATQFANTVSPEFFFTRGTLWEALATVGGYIHGIPRLVYDDGVLTVKFDLLGGDEQYTGNLPAAVYDYKQILGDEYCGAVDSTVENLLNTTNTTQGTVVEPSATTFRAVNAPAGSFRIAPDAEPVILTDQPIYKVTKLEFWYSVGSTQRTVDLTPYVFENAEYQTLSSFGGAYPYSKSYALVYTQGQKNISGLVFTAQTSSLNQLKQNYAIVNILQAVTGDTTSFNTKNGSNIPNYQFRVTYIPYVTTRITQRKPFLDYPTDNTLLYNQGGNSVENEYYGERLRGTIMRIGNVSWVRTFIFAHYADIPKCGQKIGNYYVARVDCEYERMYIKATVTAVENFNKLAEFIGINSNYRLYDVSEKQSVDRYINYSESCVVSFNHSAWDYGNSGGSIIGAGILAVRSLFGGVPNSYDKISAMTMVSKGGRVVDNPAGEIATQLGLAAGAFSSGNSIVMYTTLLDNYGAGYQSVPTDGTATRGQRLLPYGDTFGNISIANIAFGTGFSPAPSTPTPDSAFYYPQLDSGTTLASPYYTGYFGISKDSRERLAGIVLQQHFQSDDFSASAVGNGTRTGQYNIIIGSGLSKYNPLVIGTGTTVSLYFLPKMLSPIENIISLSGAVQNSTGVTTQSTDSFPYYFRPSFELVFPEYSPQGGGTMTAYSAAIVVPSSDGQTGELVLGVNFPNGLAVGATPQSLYFNFLSNAQLKTLYEQA